MTFINENTPLLVVPGIITILRFMKSDLEENGVPELSYDLNTLRLKESPGNSSGMGSSHNTILAVRFYPIFYP